MSIAGVRSNRGDGYQTLVAFEWALTILSDPESLWLEIDSTKYSVDDVVIGKANGTLIACQCKKNQIDFKAWTIAELAEELNKASALLESVHGAEIRFYSRNNFGDLAKLREHCTTQDDEGAYLAGLSKEHAATNATLKAAIMSSAPSLSTYDFLRRTNFETSPSLERMEEIVRDRLRILASNPQAAFDALWVRLDQLGARMSTDITSSSRHRLTKDDLKSIVRHAGAMLVGPMDLTEVRLSFAGTSAIGRSWRRDIAGQHISNPAVSKILAAIDAKKRSILLTGLPGSGKTCVMLALQDALEERARTSSDSASLFIQSREFADLTTAEDRQSQGLPKQWIEKAARLAESTHLIVVIDSLDVLSIAREHSVLTYFLAQIDRLLLIPNITVVTACRDFDRNYDRRIAERKWDFELKCQPLKWEAEVSPLLERIGIATASIDATTRELIKNPRELALFVELAEKEGSFNVITSQALAQRYLDNIVRADHTLGDAAIQAIETIASQMLSSRSLTVPYQRFGAPQEVLRALCSLNVLQETKDGKLTFGHQTLLDVLVISGAIRGGITLNAFLHGLPPVPFVRPSIRSYVAQLALGDRREFRKQVRAVLTGTSAFHIRRLVAESFSEQTPLQDDWPLVRELRDKHREVFQVIYGAAGVSWHHFWMRHLVPDLEKARDADGMTTHTYRVSQWVNEDPAGVIAFWSKAISLSWLDGSSLSDALGFHLSQVSSRNIALTVPLLKQLLDRPHTDHSHLGRVIARCLDEGFADDALLWRYIADGVDDEKMLDFRFDNKLRCQPYEFGDRKESFIRTRMERSTELLDLAIASIELWSRARSSQYGETGTRYRYGFLGETSYEDAHSQKDSPRSDSMDALFDAVEAAIIHQAQRDSPWWRGNRERLLSSHEGALIYFVILACTASPAENIDLIERILCNNRLLEFELRYELGTLIQSAFFLLDAPAQDSVTKSILNLWPKEDEDEPSRIWTLRARAEFIVTIPSYQRAPEAQAALDLYESKFGTLVREPSIRSRGGVVRAPFSYEEFLASSDAGVVRLLSHYAGHDRRFDDFLIGGEREVGQQLREACSRSPARFLGLLKDFWTQIPRPFRDDILDGAATYLAYRHGNLQSSTRWEPTEEADSSTLSGLILDELERHQTYWYRQRSAAKALEACSNFIYETQDAGRVTFLAIGFEGLREEDPIKGDRVGLISKGINMMKGDIADALMIMTSNLHERGKELPELLIPTLRRFASDDNPAIRALILRRLPYLQSQNSDLGWSLFHLAMKDAANLWEIAEPCLYYAYHNNYELVSPLLTRLRSEGSGDDLETWGRISALATMARHVSFSKFLEDLSSLRATEAWQGAATVWTNVENIQQHAEQCFLGLDAALSASAPHAQAISEQIGRIFQENSAVISVPIELIRRCFEVYRSDNKNKHHRLFSFHEWLNATSQHDPEQALAATEIYLDYVVHARPHLYDHEDNLTQMMTRLFAEAEEREESDCGAMLERVVAAQDTLLALGVNGVADWLEAAERP